MSILPIHNNNSSFSYNLQPQMHSFSQLSSSSFIKTYDHQNFLTKPGRLYRDMDGSMKMEQKSVGFVIGECLSSVWSRIDKKINALFSFDLPGANANSRGIRTEIGPVRPHNILKKRLDACLQEKQIVQQNYHRFHDNLVTTQKLQQQYAISLKDYIQREQQCSKQLADLQKKAEKGNKTFKPSTNVFEKAEPLQGKCNDTIQENKRIVTEYKKKAQKDAGLLQYMYIIAGAGFVCFFMSLMANIFLVCKNDKAKKRIAGLQQDISKAWVTEKSESSSHANI